MKKLFVFVVFGLLAISLSGCATAPRHQALPSYNINGVTYLPLITLCESRRIAWEYDTFSRKINPAKDNHKINLMVGESLVLVDGAEKDLKHPVDLYQGSVVVPYRFEEEILEILFKRVYPSRVIPISRIKKVVLDPGHGGKDPGAIGRAGLREKFVNLDIAKKLSSLLRAEGMEVVMTRSADVTVSLERRIAIANNAKADLFISIHSNANRVRSLKGFESYYYYSTKVSDSQRALSIAQKTAPDLSRSCFASVPSLDLKAILWDMIYTSNRAEAVGLSQSICRAIDKSNLNTRIVGIKGGPFYVLKGTQMPAILLEVGYLSNSNEENLLRNNYYRQQIAECISEGLKNYIRDSRFMEVAQR